ncbi:50S ribosomal protein L21, mitochondrial [Hordeum vulgare]|nr:50S ribosomal protein L21, mitochondrial [Hordeum vulgare]
MVGTDEKPFNPYEPVFPVVQIGSHQFKVSNGDSIFTERLKFCDVNDKMLAYIHVSSQGPGPRSEEKHKVLDHWS